MAGIGNTIETDLVGERVAVFRSSKPPGGQAVRYRQMLGRVRAVTVKQTSDRWDSHALVLWLEMVDQECLDASYYFHNGLGAIGDVLTIAIYPEKAYDSDENHFHLIRPNAAPGTP